MDYLVIKTTVGTDNGSLANSSTVSGDEDVVWVEEQTEATNKNAQKLDPQQTQQPQKPATNGIANEQKMDGTISTNDEDRFPDEIPDLSVESEEQSEPQEEREVEPQRLLASLQQLADLTADQRSSLDSLGSLGIVGIGKEPTKAAVDDNGDKGEQEVRMTIFPTATKTDLDDNEAISKSTEMEKDAETSKDLSTVDAAEGKEVRTSIFPAESESTTANDGGFKEVNVEHEQLVESLTENEPKSVEKSVEKPENANEAAPIEVQNFPSAEEAKKNEIKNEEKSAENENEEKVENPVVKSSSEKAKESAIQFSFKPAAEVREESRSEEEKLEEDEKVPETADVVEAAEKESQESGSTSSGQQSAKGVRFDESTGGSQSQRVTAEDLARLEEYEEKLRRRSKEALELVDRICGLQAQEQEKRPPIQRPEPIPAPTQPEPVRKSSAGTSSNVSSEQDQLKEALSAGVHALAGSSANVDTTASAPAKTVDIGDGPVLDVECVSVNQQLLQSPTDCLLLPEQRLLVVDSDTGLSLISLESRQLLKRMVPKANVWRSPECACVGGVDGEHVFILLEYNVNNKEAAQKEEAESKPAEEAENNVKTDMENTENATIDKMAEETTQNNQAAEDQPKEATNEGNGTETGRKGILKPSREPPPAENGERAKGDEPDWRRFICRFSMADFAMLDRIEAPKWLRERVVWQCRICFVPATQCLYLAANTPNQGFLFELRCPDGRWAECKGTRMHSQYADLHFFAAVGPVTELLLVETNRSYVQLLSVYNSTVVSSRTLGVCERPGALCVDEAGNVLVFDRATSTVGLFARAFLEKVGDLALVQRAQCVLSARQGLLAVLCRPARELKLHKYGDRLRAIERMRMGGEAEEMEREQDQIV